MGAVHHRVKAGETTWDYETVSVKEYDEGNASAGSTRRILIGRDEGCEDFIVRYFTIPPGGHSSLESHLHQHGVVVVNGKGRVRLGEAWSEIGVGDAVFIEPNEVHQLRAHDDAPLGFICVIPAWAKATASPDAATRGHRDVGNEGRPE